MTDWYIEMKNDSAPIIDALLDNTTQSKEDLEKCLAYEKKEISKNQKQKDKKVYRADEHREPFLPRPNSNIETTANLSETFFINSNDELLPRLDAIYLQGIIDARLLPGTLLITLNGSSKNNSDKENEKEMLNYLRSKKEFGIKSENGKNPFGFSIYGYREDSSGKVYWMVSYIEHHEDKRVVKLISNHPLLKPKGATENINVNDVIKNKILTGDGHAHVLPFIENIFDSNNDISFENLDTLIKALDNKNMRMKDISTLKSDEIRLFQIKSRLEKLEELNQVHSKLNKKPLTSTEATEINSNLNALAQLKKFKDCLDALKVFETAAVTYSLPKAQANAFNKVIEEKLSVDSLSLGADNIKKTTQAIFNNINDAHTTKIQAPAEAKDRSSLIKKVAAILIPTVLLASVATTAIVSPATLAALIGITTLTTSTLGLPLIIASAGLLALTAGLIINYVNQYRPHYVKAPKIKEKETLSNEISKIESQLADTAIPAAIKSEIKILENEKTQIEESLKTKAPASPKTMLMHSTDSPDPSLSNTDTNSLSEEEKEENLSSSDRSSSDNSSVKVIIKTGLFNNTSNSEPENQKQQQKASIHFTSQPSPPSDPQPPK